MIRFHFAALTAVAGSALVLACTVGGADPTEVLQSDAGTAKAPSSSSGGSSSGKTSSSGSTSSSSSSSSSSGGSTSSSSGGSTSSSGGSTSSSGGSSGIVKDAGKDADPDECPINVPLSAADLDAEIGWKSATKTPGACSATDLTQLQNNFNNPAIASYLDLGSGLSASCKACAISLDTAASWGPIVATAADNGATGFINFGACFGDIEGAACGKSLQYEQFCYSVACNECATTQAERQQCVSAAGQTGAMCKGFGDTTTVNCPNIATTAAKCNTVFDAVKTLCGS